MYSVGINAYPWLDIKYEMEDFMLVQPGFPMGPFTQVESFVRRVVTWYETFYLSWVQVFSSYHIIP